MAEVWVTNYTKNSFRYTAQVGEDSSVRTINGLNVGNGSAGSGPTANYAVDYIYDFLTSLSEASLSNLKWLSESTIMVSGNKGGDDDASRS